MIKNYWLSFVESFQSLRRTLFLTLILYTIITMVFQLLQFRATQECLGYRAPMAAIGPNMEIFCITTVSGTMLARPPGRHEST